MANSKISALTAIGSLAAEDLLAVVDDPSGSPATKKATIQQLIDLLSGTYQPKTLIVVKESDTTRNSTTTFTDDPDLTLAVAANTTYLLTMQMRRNSPVTPGFKYKFTFPSGASLIFAPPDITGLTSTQTGIYQSSGTAVAIGGSGVDRPELVMGRLKTAGTSGSLTVQWAQSTSDAADTSVLTGSFMKLEEVA